MISRADLARLMNKPRGVVTTLVNELIKENLVVEGARTTAMRGRRPTLLSIRTEDRLVVAIDVRFSRTYIMLSDFSGRQLVMESFETNFSPERLVEKLADRINKILNYYDSTSACEGIGVVIPGIVEYQTGRIVFAPSLGWKDVEIRNALSEATGLPVHIENAAKACALAQLWNSKSTAGEVDNFVHVMVSDGIGVGIVINGELLRGENCMAGEFGHMPLNLEGPKCLCGKKGCWEVYASNLSTVSRYLGHDIFKTGINFDSMTENNKFTISDLVELALAGDAKAIKSVKTSAYYLGIGIANVVHAIDPTCVYIGGEITLAWSIIEKDVREALEERAFTEKASKVPILTASVVDHPRLRGAIALVSAPIFAIPRVA
jgi:N-acetylglucosamine repressor